MKPIDLALHDWWNLRPEERARAIADVGELGGRTMETDHRRGRALNIIASLLHFAEAAGDESVPGKMGTT